MVFVVRVTASVFTVFLWMFSFLIYFAFSSFLPVSVALRILCSLVWSSVRSLTHPSVHSSVGPSVNPSFSQLVSCLVDSSQNSFLCVFPSFASFPPRKCFAGGRKIERDSKVRRGRRKGRINVNCKWIFVKWRSTRGRGSIARHKWASATQSDSGRKSVCACLWKRKQRKKERKANREMKQ